MDVVVTGIGLISALGSLEPSWYKLLQGESGIKSHQPFPDLPSRPLALIGQTVASLETLTQWVVADAIQDAGLTLPLSDCGVVIGSSRGCQASWEQLAKRQVEPSITPLSSRSPITLDHWLDTFPHQGAIAVTREIGSQQPVLAPMAACATGIWAIHRGFELIQTGQCQRVLVGAVEAPITPLTLVGFAQIGALAQTGAYPFDRNREGLVLGEGAAVLVLESADLALERGASIYGEVLGFGLTCDAYHVSAPDPSGRSAVTAIKQCLERSRLSPKDIHYIHAHGTGTRLNDKNEAQLIQYLFSHGVPVSSTKGATGHTLGSSGAIAAAFCLMALKHQVLIPCVGLRESEFDLDLVKVSRQCEVERVLCFSFGFGGQNAVMALGTFAA
ncbi:MAG TPA: beta-ketoacyl-ACP synthase [Coleofasciculaceae cyanobacterium]